MQAAMDTDRPRLVRIARWTLVACIAGTASCRALPTVADDPAPPPADVQVETARGPLSAARAKAVLEALERRSPQTNIFDRHLALEEALAGTPLVAGNRVTLLQDGPATYAAMLSAIRAAKDHVNMETYIVEDDEVGRQFAQALIAKQREGVSVSLIYDSVGALDTPAEFFKPLIDAGVKVLEFNPINPLAAKVGWNVNQRDHRKLLICDGRIAFLGGINISGVYSGGSLKSAPRRTKPLPWRDTHVQIQGPVVADFQKVYLDTWIKQKGEPLPQRDYFPSMLTRGKEYVRAIAGAPEEPFSAIYATFISAIQNAETEVWLTNAYFAPDPQLRGALKEAVRRGVDVKLILPSATDSRLIFHAGRSYYDELLAAGVKIYERRDALLHSKTAVIDGVWSTIGSTNLDWRSFLHNQEVNAVVLGPEFGTQMKAVFEQDLAASRLVTLEQWRERPIALRIKESLARIWAYWL